MAQNPRELVKVGVGLLRPMVQSLRPEDGEEHKEMDVVKNPKDLGVLKIPEEVFFEGVSDEAFEDLFCESKIGVGGLSPGVAAEEKWEWEFCQRARRRNVELLLACARR